MVTKNVKVQENDDGRRAVIAKSEKAEIGQLFIDLKAPTCLQGRHGRW
jgi:hypothetical protein